MHMIGHICILFGLLLIEETQTATNVGGVLLDNTTWTATGSPYYLVNDVQIPRNATLTIKEGVDVYFNQGDFEILVKGFLQVQGASAQQVTFKGGSFGDLKSMIRFQSTQLSSSSISYAQFNGPKTALTIANAATGLSQNTATLLVTSTQFSAGTALAAEGTYSLPPLQFRLCNFTNTTVTNSFTADQPILIGNSSILYTTFVPRCPLECIQIDNSTIKHSVIKQDQSSQKSRFNITNSNALNTTVVHFNQWSYGSSSQLSAKRSDINDFKIVLSDWSDGIRTTFIFEDSTVFNISTPKLVEWYGSNLKSNFIVRRCNFTVGNLTVDNPGYTWGTPISITITDSYLSRVNITPPGTPNSQYDTSSPLYMRNVSFNDGVLNFPFHYADIAYSNITLISPLKTGGNSKISCSTIGRSTKVKQNNTIGIIALGFDISYSTIKNFATGIQVYAPQINQTRISNSNLQGNSVYNIENRGAYNVTATRNYWGTDDVGVIISKIYDYWDNINYGDIIYTGYITHRISSAPGCAL